MKRTVVTAAIVALVGCAYHTTTEPTKTPRATQTPARIVLTIAPGVGANVAQAAIGATVTDTNGVAVGGVTVQFTSTIGSFTQTSVVTGTDGLAQTVLNAAKPATVTASVGSVSTSADAAIHADFGISLTVTNTLTNQPTGFLATALQPTGAVQYRFEFGDGFFAGPGGGSATHFYARAGVYPVTVSAVDAAGRSGATAQSLTISDPPVVTPPVVTPPPPAVLAITLECTAATHGAATGCHVVMTGADGAALTSTMTSIDWDWGDGFTETIVPPPPVAVHDHTFAVAGTYVVIATAHAPAGSAKANTSVKIP
jgi:hypothetical protein